MSDFPNIGLSKHQTFQTSDYPTSEFTNIKLSKCQTETNVRLSKRQTIKRQIFQTSDFSNLRLSNVRLFCPTGQTFEWTNVRLDKRLTGQTSDWTNVRLFQKSDFSPMSDFSKLKTFQKQDFPNVRLFKTSDFLNIKLFNILYRLNNYRNLRPCSVHIIHLTYLKCIITVPLYLIKYCTLNKTI